MFANAAMLLNTQSSTPSEDINDYTHEILYIPQVIVPNIDQSTTQVRTNTVSLCQILKTGKLRFKAQLNHYSNFYLVGTTSYFEIIRGGNTIETYNNPSPGLGYTSYTYDILYDFIAGDIIKGTARYKYSGSGNADEYGYIIQGTNGAGPRLLYTSNDLTRVQLI